ncbi:MAG: acetyl-CoA C-acetyltransferase [Coxiellaceae bacterium]|nr:acetyl-CoA C-acetyltransferase [Coxiellaceae bacterium]
MTNNSTKKPLNVYVVDGSRTPFLKARGKPGPFAASDLAVQAGRVLLARQNFTPDQLDEVVIGCMMPSENEANIGRIIGLRLGTGNGVPGWTVQRNCASGMQALDSAVKDIASGRHDLVLAGGTEAMSRAPLLFNKYAVNWFASMMRAKSMGSKMAMMAKFRPKFMTPIIALLKGLTDPILGIGMGQTAEEIAYEFDITRKDMDEFASRSQQRAFEGQKDSAFANEITALYDEKGKVYEKDDGVRGDSTVENLAKLKPFFDKKFGRVTAANSSQVTDGAALLLLASEEAVKKYDLPVMGKIVDVNWAALDPKVMGLGPAFSSVPVLQRNKLTLKDIDYWEINEAFAAQVIGCVRAMASDEFCKEHFGLDKAVGEIPADRLNVDGGAIACGHPVGASGARIVLHLLDVLKRKDAKRGIATICIGGGQGGTMLIERVEQ